MDLSTMVLWVLVGVAAAWDLIERRIPNVLIVVGLLGGVGIQIQVSGLAGLERSLLGVGAALALLIVPFSRRWIGGGDVKLLMVCGAFLGGRGVIAVLLVGAALNGLLALGVLVAARVANAAGRPLPDRIQQVPTALAIAGATLAYTLGVAR